MATSIDKLNESITSLKTAIDDYTLAVDNKITELQNAKASAETIIVKSKEEQLAIQKKITETEANKQEIEGKLTAAERTLEETIEQSQKITQENTRLTDNLVAKDDEMRNLQTQLDGNNTTITQLTTDISTKEETVSKLRDDVAGLQDQVDNIQNNIRQREMELSDKNTEIQEKTIEIDEIRKKNASLTESQQLQITKLEQEQDTLQQEKLVLEEAKNKEIEKHQQEISNLTSQLSELTSTYNSTSDELASKITELQLENENAKSTISQLTELNNTATGATEIEKTKNAELLKELIQAQEELAKNIDKIKSDTEKVSEMDAQINNLHKERDSLMSQHSNCESKINELNLQIDMANEKITELTSQITNKAANINVNTMKPSLYDELEKPPSDIPDKEAPIGVPYKKGNMFFIKLLNNGKNQTVIPYNIDTQLPQNDEYGRVTGKIIQWTKNDDGTFVKTTKPPLGTRGIERKKIFTLKGGRPRKYTKTVKNSMNTTKSVRTLRRGYPHIHRNGSNTKRKCKIQKKQTYKRKP